MDNVGLRPTFKKKKKSYIFHLIELSSRRQVTCAHRSGVQKHAQLEKTVFLMFVNFEKGHDRNVKKKKKKKKKKKREEGRRKKEEEEEEEEEEC